MALDLNYEPEILVPDITVLTEEEWLNWRKKGIGGSDVAAVLGISPWKTRRDLFYEKSGAEPMPKTMDDIILDCVIMAPEMVLPLSDPESDPQQKVYLVEADWAIDSECGHSIALFADYIGAKQQLNKALAVEMEEGCIAQWENYNDFQCESDDNYYECWLDGFYCENHYEICLREEKIHPPVSANSNINSKE